MLKLFSGRINRKTFIIGYSFWILFIILVGYFGDNYFGILGYQSGIIVGLLIGIVFLFSLSTKRFHDLGYSIKGPILGKSIPVGFLVFGSGWYTLFASGQRANNKFGKAPGSSISWKSIFGF